MYPGWARVCCPMLLTVDVEDVRVVSRRQSSVVSMPISRRSTADPVPTIVTDPLRALGVNVSMQMAAAVTAAVAATFADAPPPLPTARPGSGFVSARGRSQSTADCAVGRPAANRPDPHRQNVAGPPQPVSAAPCSVIGCRDAVSSASIYRQHCS